MWCQIEVTPSAELTVALPASLAQKCGQTAAVRFGARTAQARVETDALPGPVSQTHAKAAGVTAETVRLSSGLRDRLLIPETPVYRFTVAEGAVAFGPVIGLLLGIHTQRYNPRHMRKYSDRMGIYPKVGGLIYAFSPKSVDWEDDTAYGLCYNIRSGEWEYGCFPLPDVVYRRDFHCAQWMIDRLRERTGGRLFNSTRFTKFDLYRYIGGNEELRSFLPATEQTESFEQVMRFMKRFPKVILKPVDLSRGRGICVMEQIGDACRITDYRYRTPVVSVLYGEESLERYFAINRDFFSHYLIQQYLQLARIGDSLFDIRVVMQKGGDRIWRCSGIECRVSGEHSHLTNISRGGYALTLREALERSFHGDAGDIPQRIDEFCVKFCRHMDTLGEHFAEFGMDVAVDTDRRLWLIEANVFPSFKGFRTMDRETYLAIRYTPLLYALSLTQFEE